MTRRMKSRVPRRPSDADLRRWRRKVRAVFSQRSAMSGEVQWEAAVSLARDMFRVIDPEGWKRP